LTQQANRHHPVVIYKTTEPNKHGSMAPSEASLLGFFDLDDRLALVRSAIQTGVMRQLDLVALRADGHAWRGDAQFLCAPLVASFP
jgi:hypothetical protein